jgi:glycosyltransferase involved in cell wall biosynthesis
MDISIIIRTYNEEKYLSRVLEMVFDQIDCSNFEVIVVDSGSTDNTLDITSRFDCSVINIKKEDFSFGRSLNLGCSAAKGDILVFISAHCIPIDKFWLRNLVEPFSNSNIALSYGKQEGVEASKFSEKQLFNKYFPDRDSNPQRGFFCNNANSAIRKKLWENKSFDENLTGLEDMEWSKYFFSKGFKIAYVSKASVFHIHEESWPQIRKRYEREAFALKDIMPEVHVSFFDTLRYMTMGVILDSIVAIKQGLFFSFISEIVNFRFNQYYGAYVGNHMHRKISKKKKEEYFYPR